MILLDTNVISEPLKGDAGNTFILEWLNKQRLETLYISTITLAELRFGISVLPEGKKRDTLHIRLIERILPVFKGRILPFCEASSEAYAKIRSKARLSGTAISPEDGYIASVSFVNNFILATRNVSPFRAAGLTIINPWD